MKSNNKFVVKVTEGEGEKGRIDRQATDPQYALYIVQYNVVCAVVNVYRIWHALPAVHNVSVSKHTNSYTQLHI